MADYEGMGKAGRWLRSFLAAKKEKTQPEGAPVAALPAASPKEKKRWSFRRSVSPGKAAPSSEQSVGLSASEAEFDQKQHAVAVAVATAAAADAAVVAAHAAAAVIRLTAAGANRPASLVEDAAAVRIQASFRGYLARKALCALRGLVKLQALVRGHLVRKQAEATLRCMQALVSAQSRLRAQQLRVLQERDQPPHRRSPHHPRHRRSYEMDRSGEENIKIVEVDSGAPARGRSSCSVVPAETRDRRCYYGQCSPVPSALTELSPRACSGHFEEFSFATARSSPQYVSAACDAAAAEFFPNYMANTESSRAKARSQSAPRQRTDALERQPSRRKGGGAEPRKAAAKMQRSSSHVGATAAHGLHYPWLAVRLDRSSVSLKNSECGSTSSVLTTNTGYCRSVAGFELHRSQF